MTQKPDNTLPYATPTVGRSIALIVALIVAGLFLVLFVFAALLWFLVASKPAAPVHVIAPPAPHAPLIPAPGSQAPVLLGPAPEAPATTTAPARLEINR